MKFVFIFLIAIVIAALGWRFVARWLRRKGRGVVISHLLGVNSGFLLGFVFLAAAVVISPPPSPAKSASAAVRSESKNESQSRAASTVVAASDTVKSATEWPTVASVTVPVSKDEARLLADHSCLDDSECYGTKGFHRFIVGRYPDIAKVHYPSSDGASEDPEIVAIRKENFAQALYFAKQIQLANGENLFDFMRRCSRGFTAYDSAEVGYDGKTKSSYFDIQFFPTLRRIDNGEPVELQLLYERRGDQIVATSPFFSSNALRFEDFMQRHHVVCWE